MKEEERKRKGKVKTDVTFLNFFFYLSYFKFFMLPIYSMSVDNAVEALVSDHLRNSKKCS